MKQELTIPGLISQGLRPGARAVAALARREVPPAPYDFLIPVAEA